MNKILIACIRIVLIICLGFFADWRIERVITVYQVGDAESASRMQAVIEEIRAGKSTMGNEQIADLLQLEVKDGPEKYLINSMHKFYLFFLIAFCFALISLVSMHAYFKNKIEQVSRINGVSLD